MRRVHAMPFGAQITDEGVRFALWAPTAREVSLVLDGEERPMPAAEDGWRRLVAPEGRAGSRYGFRIDGRLLVPGSGIPLPARRRAWREHGGRSGCVRLERWRLEGPPLEETVLYELHVGTATPEGTYAGLMGRLEQLRDVGITAIELLPLAEFPGRRNWGYDGVLPFAPDSAYGTPDDLKRLIDRAPRSG